jgi:hypothetical protein
MWANDLAESSGKCGWKSQAPIRCGEMVSAGAGIILCEY